jgi:hypothetical protein
MTSLPQLNLKASTPHDLDPPASQPTASPVMARDGEPSNGPTQGQQVSYPTSPTAGVAAWFPSPDDRHDSAESAAAYSVSSSMLKSEVSTCKEAR